MQKLPVGRLLSFIQDGRSFLLGLLSGVVMLVIAGTALSEGNVKANSPLQRVVHALAELAINTSTNASNITALRARLDDLELKVSEIAGDKN